MNSQLQDEKAVRDLHGFEILSNVQVFSNGLLLKGTLDVQSSHQCQGVQVRNSGARQMHVSAVVLTV